MKDFKKKPRPKTSEEFNQILDEVNGGSADIEERPSVGRPQKSKLEKAQRLSISIRSNDVDTINKFKNSLVEKGYNNPYPTNSDIVKMALKNLELNQSIDIEDLYRNIK